MPPAQAGLHPGSSWSLWGALCLCVCVPVIWSSCPCPTEMITPGIRKLWD